MAPAKTVTNEHEGKCEREEKKGCKRKQREENGLAFD